MSRPVPAALLVASLIALGACQSRKPQFESPTVKPSDPASLQSRQSGSSGEASDGYPDAASSPGAAPRGSGSRSSGMQATASGLQYEVVRRGSGRSPTASDRVKVHYHGTLPNGAVFDSSVRRGQPAVLPLSRVIPGWREGIPLMREGAKYRFVVPPELAYGARGAPPTIGPNQTLVFDVELLEVLP